jgi:diacylglycerol kinase (ATP)
VLRYFPRIFAGTHESLPFVAMHRARRVTIATSRPIWIYADGEPICRTPVEIEVVENALTVMCPVAR